MRSMKRAPAPKAATKTKSAARRAPRIRRWPVNLDDFELAAQRRLSPMAFAYIAGGAGDERTMRRNSEAFGEIRLKPRVLVDVSRVDTSIELFGQPMPHPILLAPTAYHKLSHREGELATARGAQAAAATLVVSSYATTGVEEIAPSHSATAVVSTLRPSRPRFHSRFGSTGRGGWMRGRLHHRGFAGLRRAQSRSAHALRASRRRQRRNTWRPLAAPRRRPATWPPMVFTAP